MNIIRKTVQQDDRKTGRASAFLIPDAEHSRIDRFGCSACVDLPHCPAGCRNSGHPQKSPPITLTQCTFHYKVLSTMKSKLLLTLVMLCGVIISSCSAKEKVIG